MSRSRAIAIANGIGLVVSALVLASGIIWYPLIEASIYATLPMLFVLVVGIWLGAIWPARLALGAGNGAVIAGFAAILALYRSAASEQIDPILFFGATLLMAFGYALVALSLARHLTARRPRPA